jgi:glutathione synthase/RimK-type ligase-like ATP-grasp enzyme
MLKSVTLLSPPFSDWLVSLSKLKNATLANGFTPGEGPSSSDTLFIPLSLQDMKTAIDRGGDKSLFVCDTVLPIDTLNNKYLFIQFIQRSGLEKHIPHVYYASHSGHAEIINDTDHMTFPIIVKRPLSISAAGSYVVKSRPSPAILKSVFRKDCIVQAYITAPLEYSGNFSVYKGKVIEAVYHEEEIRKPHYIATGSKATYKTVSLSGTEIFETIFRLLDYTGFACADFRIAEDGLIKIFEINPRLGGTLAKDTLRLDQMIQEVVTYLNRVLYHS